MICRPQKRDGRSEVTRSSTNTVSPIWVIIKRLNIPALSLRALLSWFILYLLIECALVFSEAFWLDSSLVNHALWRLWLVFLCMLFSLRVSEEFQRLGQCWVLQSAVNHVFGCEQLLRLDDGQKQLFPDSCECFADSDIRPVSLRCLVHFGSPGSTGLVV